MKVIPSSSAAWMVLIERSRSGRPSIDMGIPPRPMAETWTSPMVRVFTAVLPFPSCPGSPGVVLGRRAVAREDLVEARERCVVEVDVECTQSAVELLLGARADDRARHARAGEQ